MFVVLELSAAKEDTFECETYREAMEVASTLMNKHDRTWISEEENEWYTIGRGHFVIIEEKTL